MAVTEEFTADNEPLQPGKTRSSWMFEHMWHWILLNQKPIYVVFLIIGLVLTFFLLFLLLPIEQYMLSMQEFIQQYLAAGIVVYFFALFVGVSIFWPIAVTEIFGTFIFGWEVGFFVGFGAISLGSVFFGWVIRTFYKEQAEEIAASFGSRLAVLNRIIDKNPWRMACLIRFWYIPTTAKNMLLASTRISFTVYSFSVFATLPFSILHVFIGLHATNVIQVVRGSTDFSNVDFIIILVVAIFGFVLGGLVVNYFYRSDLQEMEELMRKEGGEHDQMEHIAVSSNSRLSLTEGRQTSDKEEQQILDEIKIELVD